MNFHLSELIIQNWIFFMFTIMYFLMTQIYLSVNLSNWQTQVPTDQSVCTPNIAKPMTNNSIQLFRGISWWPKHSAQVCPIFFTRLFQGIMSKWTAQTTTNQVVSVIEPRVMKSLQSTQFSREAVISFTLSTHDSTVSRSDHIMIECQQPDWGEWLSRLIRYHCWSY